MDTQKNDESLAWFITGVSGGIGRELVREALRHGDRVVGTSRNPEKVIATFKDAASHLLAVSMDLLDPIGTSNAVNAAIAASNGNQPGDPVRAAEAIVKAIASENPPLHLLPGRLAYDHATIKLKNLQKDIKAWRGVTLDADFK